MRLCRVEDTVANKSIDPRNHSRRQVVPVDSLSTPCLVRETERDRVGPVMILHIKFPLADQTSDIFIPQTLRILPFLILDGNANRESLQHRGKASTRTHKAGRPRLTGFSPCRDSPLSGEPRANPRSPLPAPPCPSRSTVRRADSPYGLVRSR